MCVWLSGVLREIGMILDVPVIFSDSHLALLLIKIQNTISIQSIFQLSSTLCVNKLQMV